MLEIGCDDLQYHPSSQSVRTMFNVFVMDKKENCYHPTYLCVCETMHQPSCFPLLIPETLHKYTYIHPLLAKQPNELGNRWERESPCVHIPTMPVTCWVILDKPHIFS